MHQDNTPYSTLSEVQPAEPLVSTASTLDLMHEILRRMVESFVPLLKLPPAFLVTLLGFDTLAVALLHNRLVFDRDANYKTEEVLAAAIAEASTFGCDFILGTEACGSCDNSEQESMCTPTANLAGQLAHFFVIDATQSSRVNSSTLAIFSLSLVLYLALKIKDRYSNPQLPLIPTKDELKAACTPTKPTFSEVTQQIKNSLAPLYETNSLLSSLVIALACFGMALLVTEWSADILESRALNSKNLDDYSEVVRFVTTVFSCTFMASTEACACANEVVAASCTDAAALSGEVYATQSAIDETNKTILTAFVATAVGATVLGGILACVKRCQPHAEAPRQSLFSEERLLEATDNKEEAHTKP